MLLNWIYGNPTWLWGTVFVAVVTGGACAGLAVFHRFVHLETRRTHNELTGFIVAVISVTYAVLLAFIAIATWDSFTTAAQLVDDEADYVGAIYRDTQGLPESSGQEIRTDAREYVDTVVHDEWPQQQIGVTPTQGWAPLRRIHRAIVTMQPANLGQAVIQAELLRTLNQLYRARASRLSAAQGHIPVLIWWVIFFGAALTVLHMYFFGFPHFGMHLAMTASVTMSLTLVIVLIIALDWPFRGKVSISPDAFVNVEQSWADITLGSGR
ncbi:MAG: hypothetical protein ACLQBA_15675 [Candidatus Binataceae bacterium]